MNQHNFFMFALRIFFIGIVFLGISGASFRFRAFLNKKAWGGWTKPFLLIGLFVTIISLILIFLSYPQ